jgi:hypothetical protein
MVLIPQNGCDSTSGWLNNPVGFPVQHDTSGTAMPGIVVVDNRVGRDSLAAKLTNFEGGVLLGTGEGAAEVTSYAGSVEDHRVWGIALVSPRFHTENVDLREELGYIRVPVLIVKRGPDAETDRQAQIAAEECYCPVDVARADSDADVARIVGEFAANLALTQRSGASA